MNEARCHQRKNTVLYNQTNESHCFSIGFCYLRIGSLCDMHIRKGYIRQSFQGLHLKQQQKNPHIISVA